MGLVAVAGARLEYARLGPPPDVAPTLVFLHGGLGSLSVWRDLPEALCRNTGCGALVYSRRGHGGSDRLARPYSERFMHDEATIVLPHVLDAFQICDPILIGHSDGGSIALIYTGMGIGPSRGLVLEAPHVFNEDAIVKGIVRTRTEYETGGLRAKLARHHGANVDNLFDSWARIWLSPEFRGWSIEECLPGVTCPVLVIQGLDDEYGTDRQVHRIASGISGPCESLALTDCGHAPDVDQRESVEAAMTDFVARLRLRGRDAAALPGREERP